MHHAAIATPKDYRLYAYAFAFAYIELATGVGALILFTAVQLSMLLIAAWRGECFAVIELGGIYGWLLAGVSGSLTSAVGYALWFRALPLLRVSTAAVAQLSVPLIAALGGLLFVNEPITSRFILASAIILFAISLVIRSRNKQK